MSRRRVVGALAGALAALALAGLSRAPYPLHGDDEARIRLSWRVGGAEVETCRALTDAERARTPAHMMRDDQVCERRGLRHRLLVVLDGRTVADEIVRPAGIRGDRPIAVMRDLPVAPGRHRLQVAFSPLEGEDAGGAALTFDGELSLEPREVALVTMDESSHQLITRRPR